MDLLGIISYPVITEEKNKIERLQFPVVANIDSDPFIIWKFSKGKFLLGNPNDRQKLVTYENLKNLFQKNKITFLTLEKSPLTTNSKLGFNWFIPV